MYIYTRQNPPTGHYVYLYLRTDGSPYYVGKGHGIRPWNKGKRDCIHPPDDLNRILIIEKDLTPVGALSKGVPVIKCRVIVL